ncbi:protein dispatched homolog 1-like [Amphiura filiformis]|uniref:protein dispatched homolog 1-like n=1 Tax=Amphiura filiformis TaxID=82378 RepID=UPI003B20DECB
MMEDPIQNEHRPRERRCNICRLYAEALTNFYPLVCVGVILISGACAAVSFLVYDLPDFEEPTKGFEARGTPITTSLISYYNYLDTFYSANDNAPPAASSRRRKRRQASPPPSLSTAAPSTESQNTIPYGTPTDKSDGGGIPSVPHSNVNTRICVDFHPNQYYENPSLVFGAKGKTDLFTAETMKSACQLEEEIIRSHPAFNGSCQSCSQWACPDSWSLGGYVALLNSKSSCDDINSTDVANVRTLLHKCAGYYVDGSLSKLCAFYGTCEEIPPECTEHDAVYLILHYITSKTFVEAIANDEDTTLPLMSTFLPLYNQYVLEQIYLDNIHGNTFSNEDVALKAVKFRIKFRLFEQFLFSDILYVGIGLAIILIIIWIYTKSFLVMMAAFINFILSLILAYFFYVVVFQRPFFPFVNITALIMLIGIGADDTFVYMDLWRKALSEHRGGKLVVVVEDALRHATATMFVTSATTTAALFASMFSDITAVKCFALFTGITILMNFLLTLSWLPAVIILQHRLMEICCKNEDNQQDTKSSTLEYLLTPFRVFYDKILPFIVVKLQYVWIVSLTLLGLAGAIVVFWKPGLKLPSSSEFQILRTENYLEQYDLVYKNHFKYEQNKQDRMNGIVLFGVKSKYNGDPWNPDDYGDLFYDEAFEFSSPEHQLWLESFCEDLQNQTFYHSTHFYGECLINPLKLFMSRDCEGGSLSPCCNESTFPYSASTFDTCLKQCHTHGSCQSGLPLYDTENDFKLRAFGIFFSCTTFRSFNFGIMQNYWRDVNGWMQTKFATAPESLSSVFFTAESGDQLWFFDLQLNLASGTQISLGVTLAIATGILIVTILNIVLALYAILSVAFVVLVTMGSLVLLGWELNIFESVIFTLAVGLSVDFTIHYGVAYHLAPFSHRNERTEFSIQTMGSAITIAALSTFIAGALMLPSTVNAYLQLGIFMMLVMSISWVYSTFYFQALCNVFGPQGRIGELTYCCKDDDPTLVSGGKENVIPVQNGGSSRENSQRLNIISGDAVKVGDINMGTTPSISPIQPDLTPPVAHLPGTPLKNSDDESEQSDRVSLKKPDGLPPEGVTNPMYEKE